MTNLYEHPVITRLRSHGYEYQEEAPKYCEECGRRITDDDRDFFGDLPDICWKCQCREEDDLEEMEG